MDEVVGVAREGADLVGCVLGRIRGRHLEAGHAAEAPGAEAVLEEKPVRRSPERCRIRQCDQFGSGIRINIMHPQTRNIFCIRRE